MHTPKHITFTGIDDDTDLVQAAALARRYPIEWGILYSYTNRDPRFPSLRTIEKLACWPGRRALHLCGRAARDYAATGRIPNELQDLWSYRVFHRVQVNGAISLPDAVQDSPFVAAHILQRRESFSITTPDTHELFDASGGRGILPEGPLPIPRDPHRFVGYAGGIAPYTVLDYLDRIPALNFWIDMESGVRTADRFDLDKVAEVCRLVYPHHRSEPLVDGFHRRTPATLSQPALAML